jgi:hypothetical protein
MDSSSPILIWQPGGGTPPGEIPPSVPPVEDVQSGQTAIPIGQNYVDVAFLVDLADADWPTTVCNVLNLVDADPLIISVGTIVNKTVSGFRVFLSGAPDTGNYFLRWSIIGASLTGGEATLYGLSGPASGFVGIASDSFMVQLPVGQSVPTAVTITPNDGGAGGTFFPLHIMLTTAAPSGVFTYTAATAGTKTISTANDGALVDPSPISYAAVAVATSYTLAGPSTGMNGVPSTSFTVAIPPSTAAPATITITPSDGGGGGTFMPTSVSLTTVAPSATFTYTPSSTGSKTISTTNDRGLTDPASLTYTVTVALHLLNTLISYWKLDEASGTRVDSQGSNPLGVSSVSPPSSAIGIINNGLQVLLANSQWIGIGSNSTLQVTGPFTFSVWVKLLSQPGGSFPYTILGKTGASAGEYFLNYFPSIGFYAAVNTGASASIGSAITTGVWTHLLFWYDTADSKAHLRVNDATTYNASATATLVPSANSFLVGATDGPSSFADAIIDEIGFWKRLLTPGEMTALYNGGAGLPFSSFTL